MAGARPDGLGTGGTGKIKAIVHAGSRITGIVPGARRRNHGRPRTLVRTRPTPPPGRPLATVGVRHPPVVGADGHPGRVDLILDRLHAAGPRDPRVLSR